MDDLRKLYNVFDHPSENRCSKFNCDIKPFRRKGLPLQEFIFFFYQIVTSPYRERDTREFVQSNARLFTSHASEYITEQHMHQ